MPNNIRNITLRKHSPRRKSFNLFKKVIELRKKEYSYTEIKKETGLAKSTIQNWLTYTGLTLTKRHLEIQKKKKLEKHSVATEAAKRTRLRQKELAIHQAVMIHKNDFNDPFFNYGLALFESEGHKSTDCRLSNSDYRLILAFIKFIEKYFHLDRNINMTFDLYIHETRRTDMRKIKSFWIKKLRIPTDSIRIYWKRNRVTRRKKNNDYVGQIMMRVCGEKILGSKLLALSDIILSKYQRI